MDKKKLQELTADHEMWDNRELGASAEHLAFLSEDEQKKLDDEVGLLLISIRLNKSLIDTLKGLAKIEGIGYQPLIRQILNKYARENEDKLDASLSAQQANERADNFFSEAVAMRTKISKLAVLSNERIRAEGDYTKLLTNANALFSSTMAKTTDPILQQHARLRLRQIADICMQDLPASSNKKRVKKKTAM